jgi:hypothetical protein
VLRRVRQALLPHHDQSKQRLLLDVHLLRSPETEVTPRVLWAEAKLQK